MKFLSWLSALINLITRELFRLSDYAPMLTEYDIVAV